MLCTAFAIVASAAVAGSLQEAASPVVYRFEDLVVLPGGVEWAVAFAPSGAPVSVPSGVMRFGDATPVAPVTTDVFDVDPAVLGRVSWPRLLLVEGREEEARCLWTGSVDRDGAGRLRVVAEWSSAGGFAAGAPCTLPVGFSRVDWACRVTPAGGASEAAQVIYALGGVRYVRESGTNSTAPWSVLLRRDPTGLVPVADERASPSVAAFSELLAADRTHVALTVDAGRPIHAFLVERADEPFELWRLVDGVLERVELSPDAGAFLRSKARGGARLFAFVGTTEEPLLVAAEPLAGHVPRVRLTVHGAAGDHDAAVVSTTLDGLGCAAATASDGSVVAVFRADSTDDCAARLVTADGVRILGVLTDAYCDVLGTDWGEGLWLSRDDGDDAPLRFRLLASRNGAFNNSSMIWSHSVELAADGEPRVRLLAMVDRLGRLLAP